jgi:hypothetical protein
MENNIKMYLREVGVGCRGLDSPGSTQEHVLGSCKHRIKLGVS